MEFGCSEEERMIRDVAARFAERVAAGRAATADETEAFDGQSFAAMAELGFAALPWPEAVGGAGAGFAGLGLALRELSRVSASLAAALWSHVYLAAWPLLQYGSEQAKRIYWSALSEGRMLGTGVIPGAVDKASRLRVGLTVRRSDGEGGEGGYLLHGTQKYVLGGAQAEVFIVYAEMPELGGQGRSPRYSAFVVGRDCPGLTVQPVAKKLGLRAAGMAHLTFRESPVPADGLLGRAGHGARIARSTAAGVRCGLAAIAAGIARGAADAALGYAQARSQFGTTIAKHQAIAFVLADMEAAADAAELLANQAAWRADTGLADEGKSILAFDFAADAALAVSIQAVQVYGGYGYMKEYPVERCMRDAKAVQMFKAFDLKPPRRRGTGKEVGRGD